MSRRVFLIHPTFESGASHTLVYRKGYGSAIPMGLAYIAAKLREAGHTVQVYDFQVETRDFFKEIETFRPDTFGMSVTTPAANSAGRLATELKRRYPEVPLIVGGPHASTLRGRLFDETPAYDVVVVGEGEFTAPELMDALDGTRPFADIQGLCYREPSGAVCLTPERPVIASLDELPRLPLDLFDYRKYIPTPGTFVHLPNVAFLSSRGCPFSCVFCNKSMFGDTIRYMSPTRMVDEIVEMKRQWGIREINFFDDTFTVNRKRVTAFCEELVARKVDIRWKCNSRVNTVTPELLRLMKRAGCFSISYGVESGDDQILLKIKKGITTDQVRDAFRWSREVGISRAAFFMLNLPGDTRETIEKTIRFSREIAPDFISFEMTKPLPGTTIEQELATETNVKINRNLWEDWDNCSVANKVYFTQNDLTEEYLEDAFARAVKKFYLTPGYVLRSIGRIRSWAQFRSYVDAAMNIAKAKVAHST